MIPTLHPLADAARRYRKTPDGLEAEMTPKEALACAHGPQPARESLWWEVNNYASAMYLTHRTFEAFQYVTCALAMKRAVPTLVNMAVILEAFGKFERALDYTQEAARIDPSDDRATALLAEALLRMGRFAEGWPLYIKNRASMDWCKMFLPEWEGAHQDINGKRILVIEGGGYGDNLYFLRWLHTLRRWGADVHYVCQPSFAPLVRRQGFRAIENWHGNADIRWERYDYFCPLLGLGHKLGVTIENYKWQGPYVRATRRRATRPTRRIGLCWLAGESTSQRKQRSLHNEQVERIVLALPSTHRWVNLTYGFPHPECENPPLDNWLVTADLMSQLDLVVTVDTGVAHLAGAMNIPCWTILPGASAWHYPLHHDYHPLYPSMRLFRNPTEGMEDATGRCALELWRLK